jgi:hypothetical protein
MSTDSNKEQETGCSCGSCGPVGDAGQIPVSPENKNSLGQEHADTRDQGCACNSGAMSKGLKIAVCIFFLIVIVAVVVSQLFGETTTRQITDLASQDSTPTITQYTVGDTLGSLNDLNVVAMNQSAVFIYIPAAQPEEISAQTKAALLSAQESLSSLEIVVGLYTLSVNSEDYHQMVKQAIPPVTLSHFSRFSSEFHRDPSHIYTYLTHKGKPNCISLGCYVCGRQ